MRVPLRCPNCGATYMMSGYGAALGGGHFDCAECGKELRLTETGTVVVVERPDPSPLYHEFFADDFDPWNERG